MNDFNKNLDDYELWQLLVQGEKNVIEIFYKRHYDLLFNYGLKCYHDEEIVKDSIQDLFVKLYKSNLLKTTTYVKAYLLKALKNIIFDKLLRNQRKVSLEDEPLDLSIDDESLAQLFKKNDTDIRLSKQILTTYQALPKNQKMIIYLRYIKGLSHKEIAEIMDIKVQSSMNLTQRALASIREQISKFIIFFI